MRKDYNIAFTEAIMKQKVLCDNCPEAVCTAIGDTVYRVNNGLKKATISDCLDKGVRPAKAIRERLALTTIKVREITACAMIVLAAFAFYNIGITASYIAKERELQELKMKAYSQINDIHNDYEKNQ